MSVAFLSRKGDFYFTSESVSEGHPDKVCDQVSDAIVDAHLKEDASARLAIETLATTDKLIIAGEYRSKASLTAKDMEQIARDCIKRIGYEQQGFHWKTVDIDVLLHEQSPEIAQGVDASDSKDEGAGDQGIMFGYACRQTETYMPAALHYSHAILRALASARHSGELNDLLGPDAKAQVTLLYRDGKPLKAKAIVLSTQHKDGLSQQDVKDIVTPYIVKSLPEGWMCDDDKLLVNPTGKFVIGGPDGDCGLTGRKIIVDSYGGAAPHGGGAFSGKDPSKVDRSAAYAARYLAKNVVAANLAEECTIQIAYAIGVSEPVAFYVSTHDTGKVDENELSDFLPTLMSLTPRGIRTHLNLNKPIYERSAAYGHFGRKPSNEGHFSWEKTDLVDKLKQRFSA